MNKLITLIALATINTSTLFGQCSALFSSAINSETVTFSNHSTISNAHYFWNFGDGTSSLYTHPIHSFPDNGEYLVTLFAKDTVSNCSNYYEKWITVEKNNSDSCQPFIYDSLFIYNNSDVLVVIDTSSTCRNYFSSYDIGPALGFDATEWVYLNSGWKHARFICRGRYNFNDTVSGNLIKKETYKTTPYHYSSNQNYNDCSANYEFSVISQDAFGQTIYFNSMNKNADTYKWLILGFGNTIVSTSDTTFKYFPYTPQNDLWFVGLITTGLSGCKDTLWQEILIRENIQTIASVDILNNQVSYNLFPNPFSDQATLTFPFISDKTTFTLYNTNGQLVKTVDNITGGQLTIHRDNLATGLYYFMLRTKDNIIATGKLLTE